MTLGVQAFGQVRVTGTVTDASDGMALPGVTIRVDGTTMGTATDMDGRYELNVAADAVLIFTYVGMVAQEIPVQGRNVINVQLVAEATALGEVVVIGYGTGRPVGTVVGSITQVGAEKIESRPVANVWDAMQGRVSGLQVYSSSGEPSSTPSMRLHGVGSLGASSTPLYLVDGIPIRPGDIISINPNDIETVTVLKDASATSIYGSRAANGVVYITTKQGHRDTRATVRVNAQYGVSSLANEDFFQNFLNTDELLGFWLESGLRSQAFVDDIRTRFPNDTQWYKYYYKESAPTVQGDVSIQGGGGRTRYFVSGAYFQQDGLATRSMYERYSMRANISSHANDWLSFGTNINLSYDERQTNPYGSNNTNRGLAMLAQPFYTPYDEDGNEFEGVIPGWGRYNPYYLERMLPSDQFNTQLGLSGHVQINPIEGLTIRSQAGLNGYNYRNSQKRFASYIGNLGNGSAYEYFSGQVRRSITNTVEYKFNLDFRHDFTILAGQEYIDNTWETFSASATGQSDDRLMLVSAGTENKDVSHSKSEFAFNSYFGRFEYNLDRKYYFDFSLRQDASSRFGRDNQTATFWATGIMWDMKKEDFLANNDLVSSMNLKFSIGTSGNSEIANYGHLALVGATQYQNSTGWLISTPGNPALSWEKQTKATVGLDFALADDRYRISLEYYNRVTEAMLISVPQPWTSGFASITQNVGSLANNGLDFEIEVDVVRGRDFYVTPFLNVNYNKNEVTELFQGLDHWIIPNTGVAWVVGEPVAFYRPIFAGIDPADGAPMWYLPGDDTSITTKEETTKVFNAGNLEQNTGNPRYAPIAGGFGLNAGWRGLTLQMDFAFVKDKFLFNNDRYFYENPNVFTAFNMSKTVLDYWQQPGDTGTRFGGIGYQFTQFDSRLIEDASFMRLKNLTVGYRIPASLLTGQDVITGARLFVTGRNLLTFTGYEGPDPEIDSNISLGANPNTKQITFGVSVTF